MAHKKLGAQTKGTGRAAMQFGGVAPVGGGVAPVGGVGTARRDMRSGYYPDDMGMRGGPMYNKGGRTFKKGGTVKKAKGGRVAFDKRDHFEKKGSKKGVVDKKTTPNNPKWPKGYNPKKQQDPKTLNKKLPKPK